MNIRFNNAGITIDTCDPPVNLDEIVLNDFGQYTSGTNPDYLNHDKLGYIDLIRRKLHPDDESEIVRNAILEQTEWKLDEYGQLPDADDYNCTEFMEECCRRGSRDLKDNYLDGGDHHRYEKTFNTIARIIRTVMNYEE